MIMHIVSRLSLVAKESEAQYWHWE